MPLARAVVLSFATAVAMFATTLPATTTTASAAPTQWRPKAGALFNIARSTRENETILERQIIQAIRHTPKRGTIKMTMFSFDRHEVADALLAARKNRKVGVQVIVNGHEMTAAQRKLKRRLGTNRQKRSFFYQCVSSCRGQGDVNHTKFVLFSQSGFARNVVMLGSLNMKWNGIHNQFNDLLTINWNKRLYDELDRTFVEMARDRAAKPMYRAIKIDERYGLYILPFPKAPLGTKATRWTIQRDPIMKLLAPIRCKGAKTPSGRTMVRVNMHAWDGGRGEAIARRFFELWKDGCDVKLQVGFAGAKIRQIFSTRTARGYMPARSTGFDTDYDGEIDLYSHQKILLVNGRYGDDRAKKMVVTGSSNFQNGGQYGDEIILRVFDPKIFKQYIENWNYSWLNHTHGFSSGFRGYRPVPE